MIEIAVAILKWTLIYFAVAIPLAILVGKLLRSRA